MKGKLMMAAAVAAFWTGSATACPYCDGVFGSYGSSAWETSGAQATEMEAARTAFASKFSGSDSAPVADADANMTPSSPDKDAAPADQGTPPADR